MSFQRVPLFLLSGLLVLFITGCDGGGSSAGSTTAPSTGMDSQTKDTASQQPSLPDSDPQESDATDENSQTDPVVNVVSAPTGIQFSLSRNRVVLRWMPVVEAEGYRLYWSDQPGVTVSSSMEELTADTLRHQPTQLDAGQDYFYRLASVSKGQMSSLSAEIRIQVPSVNLVSASDRAP